MCVAHGRRNMVPSHRDGMCIHVRSSVGHRTAPMSAAASLLTWLRLKTSRGPQPCGPSTAQPRSHASQPFRTAGLPDPQQAEVQGQPLSIAAWTVVRITGRSAAKSTDATRTEAFALFAPLRPFVCRLSRALGMRPVFPLMVHRTWPDWTLGAIARSTRQTRNLWPSILVAGWANPIPQCLPWPPPTVYASGPHIDADPPELTNYTGACRSRLAWPGRW